jgi:hypothetical protein
MRLWDRGMLLATLAGGEFSFPLRLKLKKPTSTEMTDHFQEVRTWIADLGRGAKQYRLVMRTLQHRVLGANAVPAEIWIDTLDDAFAFIGRTRDAQRFATLVAHTEANQPRLLPWLVRRPLAGLALADEWERLLGIVQWLLHNPRPGFYLRQVDIPGVHSKFIETHKSVLTELFDLVMPEAAVDTSARGVAGFCRRYGFRDKPVRIRFRILDAQLVCLAAMASPCAGVEQDITLTGDTFSRLDLPVKNVFITENEINFLAFPLMAESIVIFGAGYGFEVLTQAGWLHSKNLYYWGDIDTHGFAILDQFRSHFPDAHSFLMDRATLLAHSLSWGHEPKPESRKLTRLRAEEQALYTDLCEGRVRDSLRLEQEHIGYEWVQKAVNNLVDDR